MKPTLELQNRSILAPLTKGGNLPFRRLCVEFGAEVTLSEMAYSQQLARHNRAELALLRSHASETMFGVQIAAGRASDAVRAGAMAVERGAKFVDLNAGCPIHDTIKRGMGATLLRRRKALLEILESMVRELPVPVTVKIRSGWSEDETTAVELVGELAATGVAAITLHARSREQRYTRSADWSLIAQVVAASPVPIIGNGDVLTWWEARDRQASSGCAAVMVARGALIKPWLFRELRESQSWEPSAEQRVEIYTRFAGFLKEHFRDDEKGRDRAMRFLPWHLGFFCRYRPMPIETFEAASREHPLMQTRVATEHDLEPLEMLLRDPRETTHARIADLLWLHSADPVSATAALHSLALEVAADPDGSGDYDEVAVAHG